MSVFFRGACCSCEETTAGELTVDAFKVWPGWYAWGHDPAEELLTVKYRTLSVSWVQGQAMDGIVAYKFKDADTDCNLDPFPTEAKIIPATAQSASGTYTFDRILTNDPLANAYSLNLWYEVYGMITFGGLGTKVSSYSFSDSSLSGAVKRSSDSPDCYTAEALDNHGYTTPEGQSDGGGTIVPWRWNWDPMYESGWYREMCEGANPCNPCDGYTTSYANQKAMAMQNTFVVGTQLNRTPDSSVVSGTGDTVLTQTWTGLSYVYIDNSSGYPVPTYANDGTATITMTLSDPYTVEELMADAQALLDEIALSSTSTSFLYGVDDAYESKAIGFDSGDWTYLGLKEKALCASGTVVQGFTTFNAAVWGGLDFAVLDGNAGGTEFSLALSKAARFWNGTGAFVRKTFRKGGGVKCIWKNQITKTTTADYTVEDGSPEAASMNELSVGPEDCGTIEECGFISWFNGSQCDNPPLKTSSSKVTTDAPDILTSQ